MIIITVIRRPFQNLKKALTKDPINVVSSVLSSSSILRAFSATKIYNQPWLRGSVLVFGNLEIPGTKKPKFRSSENTEFEIYFLGYPEIPNTSSSAKEQGHLMGHPNNIFKSLNLQGKV